MSRKGKASKKILISEGESMSLAEKDNMLLSYDEVVPPKKSHKMKSRKGKKSKKIPISEEESMSLVEEDNMLLVEEEEMAAKDIIWRNALSIAERSFPLTLRSTGNIFSRFVEKMLLLDCSGNSRKRTMMHTTAYITSP